MAYYFIRSITSKSSVYNNSYYSFPRDHLIRRLTLNHYHSSSTNHHVTCSSSYHLASGKCTFDKQKTSVHYKQNTTTNSSYVRPFSEVPTPSGALPLLGHGRPFLKRQAAPSSNQAVQKWFKELGPIFKLHFTGGYKVVYIADPTAVEKLFRNEGLLPKRNQKVEDLFEHFFKSEHRSNKCTFAFETGDKWRQGRSKLNKQLTTANINSYTKGYNEVTDRLMRNIKQERDEQGWVDNVRELLIHWSFESAACFVIGANLDTINNHTDKSKVRELYHAVDTFSKTIGHFSTSLPLYKILHESLLGSYKQLGTKFNDMYSIGEYYVNKQLQFRERQGDVSLYGNSLLDQWLNDERFTKEEAIREAISLLVPALDITTNTTEMILYELSKHSDVQYKLMNEVITVLGREGEGNGETLQRMPYLNHIIKETQRLHPHSPYRTRTLTQDIQLLGYNIPAGTPVLASQVAIGQSDKYFNKPHLFIPERWSTDVIHPFAQLPFGFGPKSCWGRWFVQVQMKILLTKLCRHFIMESSPHSCNSESLVAVGQKGIRIKFLSQ